MSKRNLNPLGGDRSSSGPNILALINRNGDVSEIERHKKTIVEVLRSDDNKKQ